ncbi:MAG: hypothetical protein JO145_09260 [Acidobacteriaceae bacterium]|nr:hypothetical protein [Acidobacteriaceae bacterium]MBV9765146.1 hypothetical protein [Acidobacteriaceae bacterium]
MDSPKPPEEQLTEALRESGDVQRLLYAAAHELKQPLRTISTYAQLLQRQKTDDPQARELTSFIVHAATEMNRLVEDLLKYSRAGNSVRRTTVKLNTVVQWAVLNLQEVIQECNAEVICEDLPELSIDESQFVQVFQQLFSNALKFRGTETPRIEVTGIEEAETCRISVRDNGPGVEPRFHEQIFEPFKRLHGKEIPGSGLGLALCKKIVHAHGGKIWVESDGVHGSVFQIALPI